MIDYWDIFESRLAAVDDYEQALQLALAGPGRRGDGHQYHVNLAGFLRSFQIPADSTLRERVSYHELMMRLESKRELAPGVLSAFEKELVRLGSMLSSSLGRSRRDPPLPMGAPGR